MSDTALRRVKIGTILRYGFEVYNARTDTARQTKAQYQIRVFHDGKLIFDGARRELTANAQSDAGRLRGSGAFTIGSSLQAGDYILQVIVTDPLADKKKQVAAQFIEFEVVG